MTDLCTPEDVLARPTLQDVTLSQTKQDQIPGYIEEASILVEGYLGHTYPDPPTDDTPNPDPVPAAAKIVTARMVARALTATPVEGNFDTYGSTMGPFAHTKHVAADVLGGGVWLTRQDKMALDSIGGIYSLQTNVAMYDRPRYPVGIVGLLHGPSGSPYCNEWWRGRGWLDE
jgi:hypothetical protein